MAKDNKNQGYQINKKRGVILLFGLSQELRRLRNFEVIVDLKVYGRPDFSFDI
jgi:hypothetical protein